MSHTVVRGKPTAAQLYLDKILDEVLVERGIKPDNAKRASVSLTQLLFHCLKRQPKATFMINGATAEIITNEEILRRSVSLARALTAAGAKGKHTMLLTRNHQYMIVLYFACLLAEVEQFLMDPNATAYELTHFLNLIEPSYVFYDREHHELLQQSLNDTEMNPIQFVVDEPEHLIKFIGNCSDDVNTFYVPDALPNDIVMLLPTSGSTGLPKAAAHTHQGLVTQIAPIWSEHTNFPTPTSLVMILTSLQWGTFTAMVINSVVYHVPILISPKSITVDNVTELLEKYRPSWTFFTPAFASGFVPMIRPDQLKSLETVYFLGEPATPELMKSFMDKLPKTARLCDGYGITEAQGFVALPDKEAPFKSNGRIVNCLEYKIVDDNGQKLGLNQTGELWIKGVSLIEKYHKNDTAYGETFTPDGWYMTGDQFYLDENERLSFIVRRKFSFKYKWGQVAPEEVERVICSVPGVQKSVVCGTDNGAAAAIVKQPNADVSKGQIHQAVNASLSNHKRLHGGIVFVSSLPFTHSGKINRREGAKIILDAIRTGDCC